MKLVESVQCDIDEIASTDLDLSIVSSGYESRSIFVPSRLHASRSSRRVALAFSDRKTLSRQANDRWYHQSGYNLVAADGNSDSTIREILAEAVGSRPGEGAQEVVRILIDYTSMTRVWYAGALEFLRSIASESRVEVYFTYAPSKYSPPRATMPNEHMGPVPGFSGLDLPDRKLALLLGLGYERGRALGLAEYVEAAETFAFYADPAIDDVFVQSCLTNNEPLIKRLGPDRVFPYPLADMRATAAKLGSLALGLHSRSYRVILAPLGPKPFTLLSFLLATQHVGFDVWRVSAGTSGQTYDRAPVGTVLAVRATFLSDFNVQEQSTA